MRRAFYRFWFWLLGWKIIGGNPPDKKYVIVVAPHTSNLDFFVGLAARNILRLKSNFLAKNSLFKIPIVGWVLRLLGGHSVDRSKKMKLVDQVVELFETNERFVMTVTPEGTRSYVPNWKTGFYFIAVKAKVPIQMVSFDFKKKVVELKEPFHPSGDLDRDMDYMLSYFRTITPRHPEKGVK
ncbi:MAG: 1-acyl-sn-glycerol-3-phosphate acyltransferase [Cyclobacteriaceae bacterium]|nr:1-acyl-sn-glycerol-3-phosphate acyltransferase [Cyclobacteriaceae bacterium HetDA_MAG_MS6]